MSSYFRRQVRQRAGAAGTSSVQSHNAVLASRSTFRTTARLKTYRRFAAFKTLSPGFIRTRIGPDNRPMTAAATSPRSPAPPASARATSAMSSGSGIPTPGIRSTSSTTRSCCVIVTARRASCTTATSKDCSPASVGSIYWSRSASRPAAYRSFTPR